MRGGWGGVMAGGGACGGGAENLREPPPLHSKDMLQWVDSEFDGMIHFAGNECLKLLPQPRLTLPTFPAPAPLPLPLVLTLGARVGLWALFSYLVAKEA